MAGEAAKKQAIQQVREVLPNYGEGFISVCLDSFQNDPQIVLQHILENSLPGIALWLFPKS